MPIVILAVLKLVLLGLLYLFVYRAVRTIQKDLTAPRRQVPVARPSRPARERESGQRGRKGSSGRRPPSELVVHPPSGKPIVVSLDQSSSTTLGRASSADVRVDDAYVSDEHVEIRANGEGFQVRDLGSTNGTYLNGARVGQPTAINAGDQLRLGKTRVEVRK